MKNKIKHIRENSAGWLIKQMTHRMDTAMNAELKVLDLDIRFFANLMSLLEQDELSQTELGQRIGEAQYTTSRLIDALEKRGLVERRKDPTSRRSHCIALTGRGRELGNHLPPIVHRVNEKNLERLDEDEQKELIRLLRKALGLD